VNVTKVNLKTYTAEELQNILTAHKTWNEGRPGGIRAILRDANLRGADLRGAYLRWADLRDADLRDADLRDADLSRADLRGANFRIADLRGATLRGAYLRGADLRGADLRGADLRGTNLFGVNFSGANLRGVTMIICYTPVVVGANFALIVGSGHTGFRVGDYIKIGCQEHTVAYWLIHVRAIAQDNGYTPEQVEEYAAIVEALAQ